jgi:hypothetical protein
MVYSDLEKFGLIGCLPEPRAKNGCYAKKNKKVREIACNKILENHDFCKKAMQEKNARYINEILGHLVAFVIACNETYYYYKNIIDTQEL